MTPSPEAGELTPERLAELIERLKEGSIYLGDSGLWVVDEGATDTLLGEAARALHATQARLEEAERQRVSANSAAKEAEFAKLGAEQEASRWKADAEKAAEVVGDLIFAVETTNACLQSWSGGMGSPANVEEILTRARALTSIRGDAP